MGNRRLLTCSSGSIAIEIALIIPLIAFLLFVTVDLIRLQQLSSRAGQAAELIADHFSQAETLTNQMTASAVDISEKVVSEHFFGGEPSLLITAIRVHSESGQTVLWTRQSLVGSEPCLPEIYEFEVLNPAVDMPSVVQYFYQVDLCVEAETSQIFSALALLLPQIQRTAVVLARTAAVRQFD